MKALVQHHYGPPGDVLHLETRPDPTPGEDEVLVRVEAAAVNPADWHLVRGEPLVARVDLGLIRPKSTMPGSDVAGRVEAVGDRVDRFRIGDRVVGCLFDHGRAGFAELVAAPAECFVPQPSAMSAAEAAGLPVAGLTALQALTTHGSVTPGDRVLVVGASGGVGSYAVQLAKAFGAHVTGVCSTGNLEFVRSLGADVVIDYTTTDYTDPDHLDDERRYDLVIQLGGTTSPSRLLAVTEPTGLVLLLGGDGGRWFGPIGRVGAGLIRSRFVPQRVAVFTAKCVLDDLLRLAELAEDGSVRTVVDRTYPLADGVDAITYVEGGHARGKVILTL